MNVTLNVGEPDVRGAVSFGVSDDVGQVGDFTEDLNFFTFQKCVEFLS